MNLSYFQKEVVRLNAKLSYEQRFNLYAALLADMALFCEGEEISMEDIAETALIKLKGVTGE